MKALTPMQARALTAQGAVLVDVRSADERARQYIPGSLHLPLESLEAAGMPPEIKQGAIFYCRSGNRTRLNAALISNCMRGRCPDDSLYVLEGGLDAWKRAGLDVERDVSRPLELQRQVHIAAGTLILLGAVLGAAVQPGFFGISALVGAGLVFAGLTGFCGMARLLMKAPWNRRYLTISTTEGASR